MISRVAESCCWLHRYMERVENTARMLDVNRSFVADVLLPDISRWRPMIIVSGEEARFRASRGEAALDDGEAVEDYLVWDRDSPVSIATSLYWARENARTIRETISLEMWESLNAFWLWLTDRETKNLFKRNRYQFYARVKESCLLFQGVCHHTVLHDEPFDFMRLGMHLERASQTSRILDVHHHALHAPVPSAAREPAIETAQWLAILRSCSASEGFLKRTRKSITGPAVVEFLLLEEGFPRAVRHNLVRARFFLDRIRVEPDAPYGCRSAELLGSLLEKNRSRTIDAVLVSGLHDELTEIIDRTTDVLTELHAEFFDPEPDFANQGTPPP